MPKARSAARVLLLPWLADGHALLSFIKLETLVGCWKNKKEKKKIGKGVPGRVSAWENHMLTLPVYEQQAFWLDIYWKNRSYTVSTQHLLRNTDPITEVGFTLALYNTL